MYPDPTRDQVGPPDDGPSPDIEKALEAAQGALHPVVRGDGATTLPEVSNDAIVKLAAGVDALEELDY